MNNIWTSSSSRPIIFSGVSEEQAFPSLLTCTTAVCVGSHDGRSHTLASHSICPFLHHLYTRSLLAVGNLRRTLHISSHWGAGAKAHAVPKWKQFQTIKPQIPMFSKWIYFCKFACSCWIVSAAKPRLIHAAAFKTQRSVFTGPGKGHKHKQMVLLLWYHPVLQSLKAGPSPSKRP